MRILVTGSREFRSVNTIRAALARIEHENPGPHTVVHGASRGADNIAGGLARRMRWTVEPHPADWGRDCLPKCEPGHRGTRTDGSTWCPDAGTDRNQEMADLGADLGLVFLKRGAQNNGTHDCTRRMGSAHIPIRRFTA